MFSADPEEDPLAELFEYLTFDEVVDRRLGVMDLSAVDLCRRNDIPIIVFNLMEPGHMRAVVQGGQGGDTDQRRRNEGMKAEGGRMKPPSAP